MKNSQKIFYRFVAIILFLNMAVISYASNFEKVSIQLRWKHQFQFAGYYAAVEKGFYNDEGLDVSLVELNPDKGRYKPILNGEVEYGISDATLLKYRLDGNPVVLLTQIFQHSPLVLLTSRKSGLVTPEMLAGKKVMYVDAQTTAMLNIILGDAKKVQQIRHSYNYDDLFSGKVDAMAAYLTDQPFTLKKQGKQFNIMDPRSYGVDFYGDNLFTTEDEIKHHPDRVKKMIRASLKGWQYALKNRQEMIDLILKKYNPKFSREQLEYEAKMTEMMIMPDLVDLGNYEKARYDRIAEIYAQLGITKRQTIPSKFFYTDIDEDANSLGLTAKQEQWLKDHPDIKLGFMESFEPLLIRNKDDEFSGIFIDYLEELNRRLGLNITIEVDNIGNILERIDKKDLDGILGIHPRYADARGLLKTTPHLTFYPAVFGRSDLPYSDQKDLRGRRVVIIDEAYYAKPIIGSLVGKIEITTTQNAEDALRKVFEKKSDFMVGLTAHNYMISKYQLHGVETKELFLDHGIAGVMGIRPDWPELIAILNTGIGSFTENERNAIMAKWAQPFIEQDKVELTPEEKKWLSSHKIIRVSSEMDWPPFDFIKDGEPQGYSIDYIRLIAEKLGVEIQFINGHSWDELVDLFCAKQIDILHPADKPEKLADCGFFTDAYIREKLTFLTRNEYKKIGNMEDLTGSVIALQKGWETTEQVMKKYGGKITPFYVNNSVEGAMAVAKGQADAVIDYTNVFEYLQYDLGLTNTRISGRFDHLDYELSIGVRKDWPMLYQLVQKARKQITQKEIQTLKKKWLRQPDKTGIKIQLSEAERTWLDNHPIISVGADINWAPVEFLSNDGDYKGLSVDYLEKIGQLLGVQFEFVSGNWQELMALARQNKIDLFSSVALTPERENFWLFTKPYIKMSAGFFALEDVSYFSDMKMLNGQKVAVVEGYAVQEYLSANYPDIDIVPVKNIDKGMQSVLKGESLGYIDNIVTTGHFLRQKGLNQIKLKGDIPYVYNQRMAVRKDRPLLKKIIQKALDAIPESEQSAIYNKWIPLTTQKQIDYSVIWKAGIVVFCIFCLILFWNRRLSLAVSRQTEYLKISNQKYHEAQSIAHLGHWEYNLVLDKLSWSEEVFKIFEIDAGKLNQDYEIYLNIIHPDDRNAVSEKYKDSIKSKTRYSDVYRLLMDDGRIKYVHAQCLTTYSQEGKALHSIGTIQDVTEQKQVEEELKKSEKRFALFMEHLPGIAFIKDHQGKYLYANESMCRLVQTKSKNLIGATNEDLFPPEAAATLTLNDSKVRSKEIVLTVEESGILDGKQVDHIVVKFPFPIEGEKIPGVAGVGVDISEMKRTRDEKAELEQKLFQSQKMESIGTLAGGIAHDFNNILAAILGYTELAISDLEEGSDKKKELDQVLSAGYRATELVQQILTFSRKSEQKLISLRIQSVIRDSLKLLRPSIPSTIEIKTNIDPACKNILANPTQIHQVIMNLCTNAYHAMRDTGGILSISLQPLVIPHKDFEGKIDLRPGHYLKLDITDTGHGIPKNVQDKIFDPYFTTKAKGEGTGMGLAVVHGIVKSLHGEISLDSEPGSGTKFHIFLPAVQPIKEETIENIKIVLPTGNERILLVDDDEHLVQMSKKMLESLDYKVTALTSSLTALDTFREIPDSFDLVITDMTMPNMTGTELAKKMFEIKPDIPVILCTGYSELINSEKAKLMGIRDYLSKPVLKRNLANIIRKVLDENRKNT